MVTNYKPDDDTCFYIILIFYCLLQKEFNYQQKAQYIHVSRWFDNIQQEEKLRQELDLISFNLLHLFL